MLSSTLRYTCCVCILCFLGMNSLLAQSNTGHNPLMADPTVFFDNGVYYLYGTSGKNVNDGFKVFTSTDMQTWTDKGFVLKKGESYGTRGFWAPQVFKKGNQYYMAYTANEHIAIASADSPLGPFRQQQLQPLQAPVRIIDPFVWADPSGKLYLYHVRLQNGNRIFVAEINDSLTAMKEETARECITATDAWEHTQKVPWTVTEGPTVVKHKGIYYMIYSANDFRNPDYAIGYATAAQPAGPWTKFEGNPIIATSNINRNGTGHGDLFADKKGLLYYVFHTHHSSTAVGPRKTALVRVRFVAQKTAPDKIAAFPDSFRYLTIDTK